MIPMTAGLGLATIAAIAVAFKQGVAERTPPATDSTAASVRADSSDTVTRVGMRDVNFYIIPTAALRIRTLRGQTRSLKGGPVVFDDKNAFVIRLDYAEIGLNGNDITELMNKY